MTADPRFGALREALSAYASADDDPSPVPGDMLQAAVALVVRGGPRLEILLIKRARRDGDPWSGHMALPGGRRDAVDATLLDTAMRETREEIGIDLGEVGARLGRLEEVRPLSVRLPRIAVTPFAFGVPADTPALAASAEVQSVHWVALDLLRDPAIRGEVEIPLPGGSRPFPCIRVVGDVVWGLTYRILEDFLGRSRDG